MSAPGGGAEKAVGLCRGGGRGMRLWGYVDWSCGAAGMWGYRDIGTRGYGVTWM